MSSLPPLEDNVDIEKAPPEYAGKEAVIIRNLQKTFAGLGKTTVKAVQVRAQYPDNTMTQYTIDLSILDY